MNDKMPDEIFDDAPSTFSISLRNGIYNEIASAIKCRTDADIQKWIARSEAHRKEMRRLKNLRRKAAKARGDKEYYVMLEEGTSHD